MNTITLTNKVPKESWAILLITIYSVVSINVVIGVIAVFGNFILWIFINNYVLCNFWQSKHYKFLDKQATLKLTFTIEGNVIIGAQTTILKGVTTAKNSIIGACSVVIKNILANEIWGGNPGKFLKNINS